MLKNIQTKMHTVLYYMNYINTYCIKDMRL